MIIRTGFGNCGFDAQLACARMGTLCPRLKKIGNVPLGCPVPGSTLLVAPKQEPS